MSTAEDIWRRKTDDEVAAAVERLDEYTDEGKQIVLAELERRRATIARGPSLQEPASAEAEARLEAARARVQLGALSVAIGALVTFFTYKLASSVGGFYFIAWGAVLYGVREIWRGWAASRRP